MKESINAKTNINIGKLKVESRTLVEKKVSSMAAREFKYFFLRLGPDNTELLNRCISYDDEMRSSHAQITTFHCHGKPLTSSPIQFIALKLITNNIKGSLVEQNFFYPWKS